MSKYCILVIDDDPFLHKIIETVARELAQEVEIYPALGGRRGLEMATQLLPDLIFLDFRMPDLDGYEVLCALRANPQTAQRPIIAVSGAISTRGRCAEMIGRSDTYLPKPFAFEHLAQTLRGFLNLGSETTVTKVASGAE